MRRKRGHYEIRDRYFHQAKASGFRARSVFKLQEIQEKFQLVKPGDAVLDVGCAPGSFLQYLHSLVGPSGKIIGFDLQKMQAIPSVETFVADIFDRENLEHHLKGKTFDTITSDLAPNTSGIKDIDQARSIEMNLAVLTLSEWTLKKGGNLLLKIFMGGDFSFLLQKIKKRFQLVTVYRPQATRKQSREFYIVAKKKLAVL